MLKRRMPGEFRSRLDLIRIDAIGLLILPVPDLYFYADVASKSANVVAIRNLWQLPSAYHHIGHFWRSRGGA